MCMHMPVPQYVLEVRGQLYRLYSPRTFIWVLGIGFWSLGLHSKCLYPLNHLSGPRILIPSAGYLLAHMNAADFCVLILLSAPILTLFGFFYVQHHVIYT